jgi:ion channel-forming bestrophin family protein
MLFLFDLSVALLYTFAGWQFLGLSSLPLVTMGGAISVFLAFRTNSAYGRWWEARTIWGALVNDSRTFARQVLTMIESSELDSRPQQLKRELVLQMIGFVCAMRCNLRKQNPFPELTGIVGPEKVLRYRGHKNVPSAILLSMGQDIRGAFERNWLDSYRWVALDSTLTQLSNIHGACERIKNTPLPRQYDYFPRLLVAFYCLLLPFGLVEGMGLLTPLASTAISFIFISLDTVGREIENPFDNTVHDTPMTNLSRMIEINLRQQLGETTLPPEVRPVQGFVY